MSDSLRERIQRGEWMTANGLGVQPPVKYVVTAVRRRRVIRSGAIGTLALGIVVAGALGVSAVVQQDPVEPVAPTTSAVPIVTSAATDEAEASPSATAGAAPSDDVDGPAFVMSAQREDSSFVAIPIGIDGTAGELIELGSPERALAFRIDERGVWIFQSTDVECIEYCYGTWSVVDPETREVSVMATDAPEPTEVQVVDGVVYNTQGCCASWSTWRLDDAAMPWAVESLDTATFSPDGTLVWRIYGALDDDIKDTDSLLTAGSAPTAADVLPDLPGSFVGWIDDETALLAAYDEARQLDRLFFFDVETRTSMPAPMAADGRGVSVLPSGLVEYWQAANDNNVGTVLATAFGKVVVSVPRGTSVAIAPMSMTTGALVAVEVEHSDDGYREQRFYGVKQVDLTTGASTPVQGLPTDLVWFGDVVAASS
ncbi:MAG: hypothetical protein HGA51_02735 [Demequinaceae bacterium]|nr:hypothetical protein [Demequinaceae bacterium]